MSKARNTGNLNNSIQISDTGNITFVSGSTTLLAISSSGAVTITGVISGSNALSASYAATASFVTLSQTASFVANAQSASNAVSAITASSADNLLVRNTLTAQTIVVQTITSSVDFVTGSTRFGSLSSNTHVFTGSMSVTGGLVVSAGNVGIGTSVASATLHVSGTTGGVFEVDGAAAVNALYVSASGRVGIGTTNPGTLLQVSPGSSYADHPTIQVVSSYADGYDARLSLSNTHTGGRNWQLLSTNNSQGNFGGGKLIFQDATAGATTYVMALTGSNVGIGTISPSALLHVSSSAAASTIFRVDTAASNGTLFVSSSGRIGIGNTNPTETLFLQDPNRNPTFGITHAGGGAYFMKFQQFSGWNQLMTFTSAASYMGINTSGPLILNESGSNVGIGTISPSALLQVGTNSTGQSLGDNSTLVRFGSGSAGGRVYPLTLANTATPTTGNESALSFIVGSNYSATAIITAINRNSSTALTDLSFTTYSGSLNERMRILGNGNVGISTTNPEKNLTVNYGSTGLGGLLVTGSQRQETIFRSSGEHCFLYIDSLHNNIYLPKIFFQRSSTTYGVVGLERASSSDPIGPYTESEMVIGSITATPLSLQTSGSRRIVITSGGNVGIGTTNPLCLLQAGNIGNSTVRLGTSSTTNTSTSSAFGAWNSSGQDLLTVRGDGLVAFAKINDFTTGNAANTYINPSPSYGIYINTSSIRYKRDIVNYDKGLSVVSQLRPVYYKGKSEVDGDKQFAGFIAEEIDALGLTEFVNYLEDGRPNSLSYPNMVALLTKAIQELKSENDSLKEILQRNNIV